MEVQTIMMNNSHIIGRLTRDPDLRYTPNGAAVASFTVAVNRPKNQNGETVADFIPCVAWKGTAELVANWLKKGSLVGVDGRIQTRNYENNEGKRVYVVELLTEKVHFLESKDKNQQSQNNGSGYSGNGGNSGYGGSYNDDPFKNDGKPIDIPDDALPF
ncbi:single-stranded DNA-binding protein [Bacillus phage 055SW001]|nr:single-stranded DNA-binding protein [Bacillus phage 022DV001]QFG05470.1 single-stranded DNA-binding protein [Bacillus phage 031MP003]QFG05559.1 single-stranded DNA-binding protein [Bacillus phage 031MP002]QFG05818.1 single-stranded DNA-binding protein [Bacillus phage 055SW001]